MGSSCLPRPLSRDPKDQTVPCLVVATLPGKEKLRSQALGVIRHVVEGAGGKPANVENVYFTSFVMQ